MSSTRSKPSEARQRILETAERLFYAEGIRSVGIDRVIAEAEVAKMSLYNHFASKDDLILAVLQQKEERFLSTFAGWMNEHARKGKKPISAFFAALRDLFESPDFRGCMFINTRVELADPEHPASKFAAGHKARFHRLLHDIILSTAGAKVAKATAGAMALLVEGAVVTAVMQQSSKPAEVAEAAVLALIGKSKKS